MTKGGWVLRLLLLRLLLLPRFAFIGPALEVVLLFVGVVSIHACVVFIVIAVVVVVVVVAVVLLLVVLVLVVGVVDAVGVAHRVVGNVLVVSKFLGFLLNRGTDFVPYSISCSLFNGRDL